MTRLSTPSIPRLLRGSVVVHRRRCGVPTCHCSDGVSLHESTVLSYSQEGRTRFLMLPSEAVEAVRRSTERHRAARAELEEQANQGIAELALSLAARRRRT
jgi:hypothetical protein